MSVETINLIKLMGEVGFLVICAGLVIFFTVSMYKRQQSFEEFLIKKFSESKYSPEMDRTCEHITNRIFEVLTNLRKTTDGSRASYIAYHNGTRDLAGSHFDQMSCRVESVLDGVPSLQLNFQRIPRSFLITWCNKIREKKDEVIAYKSVEDIKSEDYTFYDFLKSRGTKAVLGKALLDSEGHVRGFIVLEYNYEPDVSSFNRARNCMRDKAVKVGEELIILDREEKTNKEKITKN